MSRWFAAVVVMLAVVPCAFGEDTPECDGIWTRPGLTGDWGGARSQLAEAGIELGFGITQVAQQNWRGGTRHDRDANDWAASYDFSVLLDLAKAAGWAGASIDMVIEGSQRYGLNPKAVGALSDVNADAAGYRTGDVTELFFEQSLFDGKMVFRIGKLSPRCGFTCYDCKVAFDRNRYAHDEVTQFLNAAFKRNPTIAFPENGWGAAMFVNPVGRWYVAAGMMDADARPFTSGYETAVHGPDNVFLIAETGVTPVLSWRGTELPGAYRVGGWMDRGRRERLDGGHLRDPKGFYVSVDQQVWRENVEDLQGVGLFGRYGVANAAVSEVKTFWSAGVSWQGLIPKRDNDVLACGVAQGRLSARAFTASHETAFEMYYNAMLAPWLSLTGDAQFIANPGGRRSAESALVTGLRLVVLF